MIKLIRNIAALALLSINMACDEENIPVALEIQRPLVRSAEYLANLRTYKKENHQVAFGWFGNWYADGASKSRYLTSAPDSMDILSIWSKTAYNLTESQKKDLKYVQEVLGTKVTYTVFSHNVTNLFYGNPPFENIAENIPAVAKALSDSIHKYGFSGIDFDHECGPSDLFYKKENMTTLLREMRENLGPDKLIMLDGKIELIAPEAWQYVNYAIPQTYGIGYATYLQRSYDKIKNYMKPEQFIVTDNFEDSWRTGGVLLKQAEWNPTEGKKGGCGTYHMEYEYNHSDIEYKYIRAAIQIMNPAGGVQEKKVE